KEIIPERVARQYKIIPLSALEDSITVALADPLNVFVVDDLKHITGKEIEVVMSTGEDILKAIDAYYGVQAAATVSDISKDIDLGDFEIVSEQEKGASLDNVIDESEKAPIIRMVNLLVKEALRQRASDIHIEPMADTVRVRYRVDGVLKDILEIPKVNQNAVTVRIKIMSRLDITTTYVPQDGRFKLKIGKKEVDFRVSILPVTFGEKIVMRVLDRENLSIGLEGLGFTEGHKRTMEEAIKKPFGMILVTGPTGSGKSTTLYSVLNTLNTVDRNIITVEDPVEYLIDGLTQIHTHAEIGLTFVEGLRAILRQSPDVVMVGEIRDNETADIAIKASLTGQLVLSTLHTNDAAGALTRLVDMGVEPFLVASSLILISAQRLCRRICEQCKEPTEIPKDVIRELRYPFKPRVVFYAGKGCKACHNTGYRGRLGITEVLDIDDTVREMLLDGKSSDEIKRYAREKKGMATLWEDAMEKCVCGLTSLEEVLRVTTSE
ncbi:MAG: type II/IV secretion system protein, partial [Candidatus Omnitrophica bacterium]|nr:type II/IV secretion system protein [Candidatus Omnitrophota bacterium]